MLRIPMTDFPSWPVLNVRNAARRKAAGGPAGKVETPQGIKTWQTALNITGGIFIGAGVTGVATAAGEGVFWANAIGAGTANFFQNATEQAESGQPLNYTQLADQTLLGGIAGGVVGKGLEVLGGLISSGTSAAVADEAAGAAVNNAARTAGTALSKPEAELLLSSATRAGKNGVSDAGRALQSHATREGGWLADRAVGGNAAANTAAARQALSEIISAGNVVRSTHPVWGDIITIRLPDGAGAVWKAAGNFVTFLERYTQKPLVL